MQVRQYASRAAAAAEASAIGARGLDAIVEWTGTDVSTPVNLNASMSP